MPQFIAIAGALAAIAVFAAFILIRRTHLEAPAVEKRRKVSHVGAPACFALELACQHLNRAFGGFGCYLVGSAIERPDWRDVDVRLVMPDDEFLVLFPDVDLTCHNWEFDPRWLLMTVSISDHLRKVTGLPVDFQFQPQGPTNERHKGPCHPLGLRFQRKSKAIGVT